MVGCMKNDDDVVFHGVKLRVSPLFDVGLEVADVVVYEQIDINVVHFHDICENLDLVVHVFVH